MSTRINPAFYGAENSFITITTDIAKKSAYTIADLFSNGNYTGGSYDATASPWGIGNSSISSDYQAQATKGATWTIYSHVNERKNTPIWFYSNVSSVTGGDRPEEITGSAATNYRFARMLYKNRTSPDVELSGNNLLSKLAIDENDEISVPNTNTITPVTFLDYSKTRVCLNNVYYKNENPYFGSTSFSNFAAGNVTTDAIFGFDFSIRDIYGNILNVYASIGGSELTIPDFYKACYYGDDASSWVRPWRRIQSVGYWSIPNLAWREFNSSTGCINTADMETLNANDNATTNTGSNGWGHSSETLQTFSDVSYHWEMGFTPKLSTDWWDITKVQTGDTYLSGLFRSYAYMVIDNVAADYESLTHAILHEIAFLGLPFCFSTSKATSAIGSDDIYLPVFDEHLITTGNYLSGSDSLNLPNATWTDIFSDTMPEYDPEYEPEPPEPGDDDQGDLSNEYPHRYSNAGGLAQYVVDQRTLLQLAAFLNGSYLPTAADLDADFKGTNPMDYIVSVQKYPFTLPNVGTSSDIYIGKNNTSLQGKKLFPDFGGLSPIAINSASTFDFGSISIPYYFNDFRDYQSKIFLFMPFIGTDELDPRLYIGHALSLVYRVDYNTGSVIAEIKRDGLTMETKNGTISITVPFLAANMGAYQNQLAQLAYSKDMTKIKGVGTALSAGFTMAAGASGTLSSGQFPLAAASNLAQSGVQLAANATQLSQLDYQIEHTAPQLGTISTAGAATAFFMDDRARIIIARPKMLDGYNPTQYSHTIGNACCKTGTLSAFSGYTQAATAVLDDVHTKQSHRQATEQERQLLRRALQNGIYL